VEALESGEASLREHFDLEPVSSSKFARVYRLSGQQQSVTTLYFKQYIARSTLDVIKHLVRASRARRAFEAAKMLTENGFEVPAVVAMGECRCGLFDKANFLVTLEIRGAKPIYKFVPDRLENLSQEQLRQKRDMIRAFGRTVGRMHAKGIFHGDLRLGNVLAKQGKNGWRFFFLDNERTRRFYRLPPWLRLKNLVQINMFRDGVTQTDRMRFLRSYMQENGSMVSKQKALIQKIIAKTDWRLENKDKYFV